MDVVMGALKAADVTVLFIEHDMEIVERYVGRVLAFYQGEIICDAPPAAALVDPKVQEFVIGQEAHRATHGSAADA
jgi:branched-chain amino acid transport system ATP-binding protein